VCEGLRGSASPISSSCVPSHSGTSMISAGAGSARMHVGGRTGGIDAVGTKSYADVSTSSEAIDKVFADIYDQVHASERKKFDLTHTLSHSKTRLAQTNALLLEQTNQTRILDKQIETINAEIDELMAQEVQLDSQLCAQKFSADTLSITYETLREKNAALTEEARSLQLQCDNTVIAAAETLSAYEEFSADEGKLNQKK
jgi:chromosome segregation ATPase